MHRLICAFVVRIWHKQVFLWRGSFDILHVCVRSHSEGPEIWMFVWSLEFPILWAKALVRLHGCADMPEPLLVAYVIRTIFIWAGSIIGIPLCYIPFYHMTLLLFSVIMSCHKNGTTTRYLRVTCVYWHIMSWWHIWQHYVFHWNRFLDNSYEIYETHHRPVS